jgi:hypothetical protein
VLVSERTPAVGAAGSSAGERDAVGDSLRGELLGEGDPVGSGSGKARAGEPEQSGAIVRAVGRMRSPH